MSSLRFPNGTPYGGQDDGDGNTPQFRLNIDGVNYIGSFRRGLFSGQISVPYDEPLYGHVEVYRDGRLVDKYGIDEDGMIV